jgi:hypothetical protein
MKIYIVRCMYGELKAFSCLFKAQAFCDAWNSLLPVFREFSIEDDRMFDFHMEEQRDNVWCEDGLYISWREDRMKELGISDTYTAHASAYEVEELEVE